jgi:hypothetical protein
MPAAMQTTAQFVKARRKKSIVRYEDVGMGEDVESVIRR